MNDAVVRRVLPVPVLILIALILAACGGQPAGHPLISGENGTVVGPAPWTTSEGSRVSLCRVVGDAQPPGFPDPMNPLRCIFAADLTARLDANGDFTIRDVPPGWYVFFHDKQTSEGAPTYDDMLSRWDGQTIPIGDVEFAMSVGGQSDTVSVPAGCPLDNFQNCMVYALVTFNQPGSPIQLATDLSNDLDNNRFTYAVAQVTARSVVRVGFGQGEVIAADPDADNVLSAEDNCPDTANVDQANRDADTVGDACDSCPDEAGPVGGCPDADGDGIGDPEDNCPDVGNPFQFDANADEIGDACQDTDGDGVNDETDLCPGLEGDFNGCPDADDDAVPDPNDLCPEEAGSVSGCPDPDGDGAVGPNDQCPDVAGYLNGCPDTDNDGVADDEDNCPQAANSDQADGDNNGIGDTCQDGDADGAPDLQDACPDEAGLALWRWCPAEAITVETAGRVQTLLTREFYLRSGALGSPSEIALSQDGSLLAVTMGDETVRLWDIRAGMEPIMISNVSRTSLSGLTVSPDGQYVAAYGEDYDFPWTRTVWVWNRAGHEVTALTLETGQGNLTAAIAFSPDGSLIAAASMEGNVFLWDTAAWTIRDTLRGNYQASSLVFSPDGSLLGVGVYGGALWIWDLDAASRRFEASTEGMIAAHGLVFSPDGERVVRTEAIVLEEDVVHLWDVATRESIALIELEEEHVAGYPVFSPDGSLLVFATREGRVLQWDGVTGESRGEFEEPPSTAVAPIFSPDGSLLVAGLADNTICLWSVETGEIVARLEGHTGPAYRLLFNADGTLLVSARDSFYFGTAADNVIRVWGVAE